MSKKKKSQNKRDKKVVNKKVQTCSFCLKTGHNKRTCAEFLAQKNTNTQSSVQSDKINSPKEKQKKTNNFVNIKFAKIHKKSSHVVDLKKDNVFAWQGVGVFSDKTDFIQATSGGGFCRHDKKV